MFGNNKRLAYIFMVYRKNCGSFADVICQIQMEFAESKLLNSDWDFAVSLRAQLILNQHWFTPWFGTERTTRHYLNQWCLVHWCIYASPNSINVSVPRAEVCSFSIGCVSQIKFCSFKHRCIISSYKYYKNVANQSKKRESRYIWINWEV